MLPPLELMDFYRRPSNFQAISSWLEQACREADALVCSLDQLAYGGLLASRTLAVGEREALGRIDCLRRVKRENPGLRILLGSVIMRTTVSTLCQEDQRWWEKVARYSRLAGAVGDEAILERRALEDEIPPKVLRTFLAARARNRRVNREAVELLFEGVADRVVFLQEDSAPEGMHRVEQRALVELAGARGVQGRVSLHCGADEFACALVGLLAASGEAAAEPAVQGRAPEPALRLYVEWLGGDEGFTALYEDRPFAENLEAYLGTCQIERVGALEAAQAALAIWAPDGGQADLALDPGVSCRCPVARIDAVAERLEALMGSAVPVGLLDVYHANGGESSLLGRLARQGLLPRLAAYAGWNTASNSLGTVLGQLLAASAPGADAALLARFTAERLLDDWVYQGVVRPRLNEFLRRRGEDVWDLASGGLDALAAADDALKDIMGTAPETRLAWQGPFEARLFWPRTFEALVTISDQEEEA